MGHSSSTFSPVARRQSCSASSKLGSRFSHRCPSSCSPLHDAALSSSSCGSGDNPIRRNPTIEETVHRHDGQGRGVEQRSIPLIDDGENGRPAGSCIRERIVLRQSRYSSRRSRLASFTIASPPRRAYHRERADSSAEPRRLQQRHAARLPASRRANQRSLRPRRRQQISSSF
jgi:hypothetical protein